jgi:hypothetical protein
MPWSDTDHVADVFALFEEHGVSPGALGVLQDQARRVEDSTADWTPFHRNFPFQGGALLDGEDRAHPHSLDDDRERTGTRDATLL